MRAGFVPLRELVQSSFATIEQLQQHKGLVTGVPSGFVDLDEMTSGFQPSDLVIVAARPSMGKTSFVLNIAQHVGTQDRHDGRHLQPRNVERAAVHAHADVRSAHRRAPLPQRLSRARRTTAACRTRSARWPKRKVFIDDTPSIGVLEMRAKARRLKAEHGLDLLIIDYIQLMQGRGRFESRQQELASISRSLKVLAKELNVPIVALSQLSRARRRRAPTTGRSSRTCASPAPSSRTPTSSCSSSATSSIATRTAAEPGGRRHRRDHHRQAAQRPDRHGEARVHQGVHALREPRPRRSAERSDVVIRLEPDSRRIDPADRRSRQPAG